MTYEDRDCCHGRGWWQNEFLDELYCDCPIGQRLKEQEAREGRLPDDEMPNARTHQ